MNWFELINFFIRIIGWSIEYIGIALVIGAVVISLGKLVQKRYTSKDVRGELANRIIFGLEFVIAGDVLLATVATDLGDILRLGAIVVIRILLGYALRKETIVL
jgi:uncharacterized membrane protein